MFCCVVSLFLECFTGKYTTHKIHARLHLGTEWPFFLYPSEYINDVIVSEGAKYLWYLIDYSSEMFTIFSKVKNFWNHLYDTDNFQKFLEISGK